VQEETEPRSGGSTFAAGKLNIVGLERIRARLGTKWPLVSHRVHKYFEAVLALECRPSDIVMMLDELSYIVMLRGRTLAEAETLCAKVAQKIARYCFGEGDDISVRALVGEVEEAALYEGGSDLLHGTEKNLERFGREIVVPSRTEEEKRARQLQAGRQLSLAYGDGAAAANSSENFSLLPEEVSYLYRPIWDPAKSAVYSYLCQPLAATNLADLALYAGGFCHAMGGDDAQAALDRLVLRQCMTRVDALQRDGKRLLITAPLHFHTLATPHLWRDYLRLYQEAPAENSRVLGFMIFGIGDGVPNVRLAREFPKLTLRAKYVYCAVGDRPDMALNFAHTSIKGVGMSLSQARPDKELIAAVRLLGRRARSAGVASFVLGAPTRSLVLNAIDSGVRGIEGRAVQPPILAPNHGFSRGVEDLYLASERPAGIRSLLNASQDDGRG
jgi:hypothetical protein